MEVRIPVKRCARPETTNSYSLEFMNPEIIPGGAKYKIKRYLKIKRQEVGAKVRLDQHTTLVGSTHNFGGSTHICCWINTQPWLDQHTAFVSQHTTLMEQHTFGDQHATLVDQHTALVDQHATLVDQPTQMLWINTQL